jgi:EpsI family protein
MSSTLAPATDRRELPPIGWAAAWGVVTIGVVCLLAVLAIDVWPKRPEMGDRFLIPIASAALLWLLRPRWRATPGTPSPAGLVVVAAGAVGFPVAWFLMVQVTPRTLLLWWMAVALLFAANGLLIASQGPRRAAVVLFPMLFALFALPVPDVIQSWLLPSLKGATASGAATILSWLGIEAERTGLGYTLSLPNGQLDVVDACSGALSLTSLLAIAVLTAYVRTVFRRDFSFGRGIALVALTIPIVIASNTLRVVATGLLHNAFGPESVQGWKHEALGYAVILVGFGLIVAVSQGLAGRRSERPSTPAAAEATTRSARGGWVAVALLVPAAAACLWAEQFRKAHTQLADLADVSRTLVGWTGTDETVPPEVEEMLKCDQIIVRQYRDHLGHPVEVYLMFWATPASTAHIHHPDVCWPSRGCTVAASRVRPVTYAAGREPLGVSVRHYDTPTANRQVVMYWTQNGNDVLPDGREAGNWRSEYAWVWEMLRGRPGPERTSRLSVLLGADVPLGRPETEEDRLADLSGQIAAELYRTCPWAAPPK